MSVNTYLNNQLVKVAGLDTFSAGQTYQVEIMPAASSIYENTIYQFVGTTTSNYTNGYFYKCVSDGGNPASYSWLNIPTGPSGGASITVEPLSVSVNGIYTAPSGKAYSPVTVSVASGAEIITRAAWDAMTTAQKQAKGLVAIQDSTTGYKRGEFVNGADYVELNTYIPYSDNDTVICSARAENFDATENSWGDGSVPVVYVDNTKKPTFDATENAVLSNGKEGVVSYVPAGWGNFTAYVVMKAVNPSSYASLLCCIDDTSGGHGITLIGGNIYVASYQSDTQTGISSADYFVGAIKYGIGTAGYVYDSTNDDVIKVTKNPPPVGGNITIGKMSPTLSNREEAECLVKFLGVTNVEETDAVIEANIRSLYNTFIAGE